jgi:antitoxin (DNA-binding transcriptional repressor) of toxin-antitoxin stability system
MKKLFLLSATAVSLAVFSAVFTLSASAELPADPGLYYEGIEDSPRDFALYGLMGSQDDSGAFGFDPDSQLSETYFAVKGLLEAGYDITLPQIASAVSFLSSQEPKNKTEEAYVLFGKKWSGVDISGEISTLLADQNDDGGFGWKKGYASDPLSSISVLKVLDEYPSIYSSERNAVVSFLQNLSGTGGMKYNAVSDPDVYLSALLIDALENQDSASFPAKGNAKTFLENQASESSFVYSNQLEAQAFSLWVGKKQYNLDTFAPAFFTEDLLYWQGSSGLIRQNITLTSMALPFLPELIVANNVSPNINILEPDGVDDIASANFSITWTDDDPDDDANISLYYDTDDAGEDGTLIVADISEDDVIDSYIWGISAIPNGDYYIYAVIDDGVNTPVTSYSGGAVTVSNNTPPTLDIVAIDASQNLGTVVIGYTDEDPDDNASISFYYDTDNTGADGTLIAENIPEDDDDASGTDQYYWGASSLPVQEYYIYAVIDDGVNNPVVTYFSSPLLNQIPFCMGVETFARNPYTLECNMYDTCNAPIGWEACSNDVTPPIISGETNIILPAGSTSVSLSVNTNELALCKFDTAPGVDYESMSQSFTPVGNSIHNKNIVGLADGNSYTYYVRCKDWNENANTSDFQISVSVGAPIVNQTLYEDGNDASDWAVYDSSPNTPVVPTVTAQNGDIVTSGNGTSNLYGMFFPTPETTRFIAQWDWELSVNQLQRIYFRVDTNSGLKYLRYRPENLNCYAQDSTYVYCGIGTEGDDGQRHTYIRDLQADMDIVFPGEVINNVSAVYIRGDSKIDNIILKESITTSGQGDPIASLTTIQKTGNGLGSLVLSATPDTESTFTGWDGFYCGGTDDCEVFLSESQSITTDFISNVTSFVPRKIFASSWLFPEAFAAKDKQKDKKQKEKLKKEKLKKDKDSKVKKSDKLGTPNSKVGKSKKTTIQPTAVFIENQGQVPDHVLYYAQIEGGFMYVTTDGEVFYDLQKIDDSSDSKKKGVDKKEGQKSERTPEEEEARIQGVVIKESFTVKGVKKKGKQKKSKQKKDGKSVLSENASNTNIRFLTKNGNKKAKTFESLNLGEVAEGVELRLTAKGKRVEKIFAVQPGADPSNLDIDLEGVKSTKVNDKGELEVETDFGNATFTPPIAFQEKEGKREYIDIKYQSNGKKYTFDVEEDYDISEELFIDPLLSSTFIGGGSSDFIYDMDTDANGNIIVAGKTYSSTFPTTPGAYDRYISGGYDSFVAKFDSSLNNLLSATYLGGSSTDYLTALAVDNSGNVYVAGRGRAGDYPGSGLYPYDQRNTVLLKFNSDLDTIIAAKMLGGTDGYTYPNDIIIANDGSIFVAGYTESSQYPTTSGAVQTSAYGYGDMNGFISRFSNDFSTLIASTYLGGDYTTYLRGITQDSNGNIYVVGDTDSEEFPVTPGAYDTDPDWYVDVFVTKLDPNLQNIIDSTFFGGDDDDYAYRVKLDTAGNVVIIGDTYSYDLPTTSGAFDRSKSSYYDTYVAKFNSGLDTLLAATYIGGNDDEYPYDLLLDANNNVYVTGETYSSNFPTTSGAFDETFNGVRDIYVSKFSPDLTTLQASTYLGGSSYERPYTLRSDSSGNVLLAGYSKSTNFPMTSGFDTSLGGTSYDGLVVSLSNDLASVSATAPNINVDLASVDYGYAFIGEGSQPQSFIVLSDGSDDLQISNVELTGADPDEFTITDDTCSGQLVPSGTSCSIEVEFDPQLTGDISASLEIDSNDSDTPTFSVPLSGYGLETTPTITLPKTGDGNGTITITPIAEEGYEFVGWTGDGCSGMGDCVLDMSESHSVGAEFTVAP